MKFTQTQKSGKHSISNLTESDLIEMYHCLVNKGYAAQKMADKIKAHLVSCQDEDVIQEEYSSITVEEYIERILNPECLYVSIEPKEALVIDEAKEIEDIKDKEDDFKLTAYINQDSLTIKGGHQEINIQMKEVTYTDVDILIRQLETIRNTLI